ncbi:hypothetical protein DPX16_22708 [Anabarilius grahami]|uniref:Uncharacterized protein n=1 Tax=Anabarilius grahami TaxID=495550 RepID=A0A3N0XXD3_ANAGA|nr:hypothetical protein DPX16_22708 [Anabarilius grahami]
MALERTRNSSASIPVLASMGSSDGRWAGSSSPAHSSVSEAASDMNSSSGSFSEPPKETRSLTSAEGRCSGRKNRTGDGSLVGEGEARGHWADMSSPESALLSLPSRLAGGRKREGARGGTAFTEEEITEPSLRSTSAERRDSCPLSEGTKSHFLFAGLNTATKEQLSGEGPRGSFTEYVEWVLVSCDSPLSVDIVDDNDTSPTSYPVPSHQHPDCEDRQHEPTASRDVQPSANESDRAEHHDGA